MSLGGTQALKYLREELRVLAQPPEKQVEHLKGDPPDTMLWEVLGADEDLKGLYGRPAEAASDFFALVDAAAKDEKLHSLESLKTGTHWRELRAAASELLTAIPDVETVYVGDGGSWQAGRSSLTLPLVCRSSDLALSNVGGILAHAWRAFGPQELLAHLEERGAMEIGGIGQAVYFEYLHDRYAVKVLNNTKEPKLYAPCDFDALAGEFGCMLLDASQGPAALRARFEVVKKRGLDAGGVQPPKETA